MRPSTFFLITGVVFAVVALGHTVRLVFGWEVVLAGWTVPLWLSAVGVVFAGALAYEGFRLRRLSL